MAPELLSYQGRVTVLTIWALMLICAIYGATQVEINFAKEFFIPPDTDVESFFLFDKEYFKTGFGTGISVQSNFDGNPDIDYPSEEVQLTIIDFWDKLVRCYLCDEAWFHKYIYRSWYL